MSFEWMGRRSSYVIEETDHGDIFPDGRNLDFPDSWALQAMRIMPDRVRIMGFSLDDNPEAIGLEGLAQGHDFALLDGRYIIDGWLHETMEDVPSPVIDTEDPKHREILRKYFGSQHCWSPSRDLEEIIETENINARHEALFGIIFPNALDDALFAQISSAELSDLGDDSEIDPEDIIVLFNDLKYGLVLTDAVDDMARDFGDNANPSACCRREVAFDEFTYFVCMRDEPERPITMVTLSMSAAARTELDIRLEMVFTDAEFRGEGFGKMAARAGMVMMNRAHSLWKLIPGTEMDAPSRIIVTGDTVSNGGEALLACLQDYAETFDMNLEDDLRMMA